MSTSVQPTVAFNARRMGSMLSPEVLYRVYFAPGGLFFIRVGGERGTSAYMRFGLIGLLVHAFQNPKGKVEEKVSDLDQRSLKDRLEDHKANFRTAFSEIRSATIDPRAIFTTTGKNCGRMVMKFEEHGKKTFEFEEIQAMKVAVDELPKVLGDRLKVNVEWNDKKKKFVKRRKK
jgi:hypothetical protein